MGLFRTTIAVTSTTLAIIAALAFNSLYPSSSSYKSIGLYFGLVPQLQCHDVPVMLQIVAASGWFKEGYGGDDIKIITHGRELLASKPLTLGYVFLLARMIEARLEDNRSTTTIAKPNDLVQVQRLEETTFYKSNKVEETEARVEETAKRSLDANEEVMKAHTVVHGLEKQEEKLPMELQLNNNFMETLETKDLKKMMIDLNPMLHDLQEVKTKRALKIDDEEFKKAKSEANRVVSTGAFIESPR
nr:coiled-coil domain-containing protein 18-like [Tanacetum cinerariifolium]